jgi:predicted O-methyltransferase YrrM
VVAESIRQRVHRAALRFLAARTSSWAAEQLIGELLERERVPERVLRRVALETIEDGELPESELRRLTNQLFDRERTRHIFLDELNKRIKAGYPGVENMPFDLPTDGALSFENLSGLFASTALDELIITMSIRQSAYLFGLIRRMRAQKVIEIGRQWGGSTLLIAAAMNGQGKFWSIDDPGRLQYDIEVLGRTLERPVEDQVAEVCAGLGLKAEIIVGDSRTYEVETGEVDLVFIDGDHEYSAAKSDFERFGQRVRVGGAVLFDDGVYDPFVEPPHTADVKRVVQEVEALKEFRVVKRVQRLIHFERTS